MNLSTSDNPARTLTWQGKSLATCSKEELIACILHLTEQLTIAQKRLNTAGAPVTSAPAPYFDDTLEEEYAAHLKYLKDAATNQLP